MIKEVNYYPQYLIEETKFNEKYAVISITDSAQDKDGIAKIEGTENILRLHFLDIEEPSLNKDYTSFNESIAIKLINFVKDLENSSKEINVAVHCRMGASRSPAVALYIHKLTNCEFPGYEVANTPNKLVLDILEKISGLTIDIPEKKEESSLILLIPKIKIK